MSISQSLVIDGHAVCDDHYDKIKSGGPKQWNAGMRPEFMAKRKRV